MLAVGICGIFGTGTAAGVTSVRGHWGLTSCPTKPMPDGSKTDPLLPKAEPINDAGSTSVLTYVRR